MLLTAQQVARNCKSRLGVSLSYAQQATAKYPHRSQRAIPAGGRDRVRRILRINGSGTSRNRLGETARMQPTREEIEKYYDAASALKGNYPSEDSRNCRDRNQEGFRRIQNELEWPTSIRSAPGRPICDLQSMEQGASGRETESVRSYSGISRHCAVLKIERDRPLRPRPASEDDDDTYGTVWSMDTPVGEDGETAADLFAGRGRFRWASHRQGNLEPNPRGMPRQGGQENRSTPKA